MRRWLVDHEGGGLDQDHVHLFTRPERPESVSPCEWPRTIERQFEHWLDEVSAALALGRHQRWRRLYLYFSGHGIAPSSRADEVLLLLPDAGTRTLHRNLPGRLIAATMREWGQFEEVVLFMDCCRDQEHKTGAVQFPLGEHFQAMAAATTTRFHFGFATRYGHQAREITATCPQSGEDGITGAFTQALLESLWEAREVGGIEHPILSGVVRERTLELLAKSELDQHPPDFASSDGAALVYVDHVAPQPEGIAVHVTLPMGARRVLLRWGVAEGGQLPVVDERVLNGEREVVLHAQTLGLHVIGVLVEGEDSEVVGVHMVSRGRNDVHVGQ